MNRNPYTKIEDDIAIIPEGSMDYSDLVEFRETDNEDARLIPKTRTKTKNKKSKKAVQKNEQSNNNSDGESQYNSANISNETHGQTAFKKTLKCGSKIEYLEAENAATYNAPDSDLAIAECRKDITTTVSDYKLAQISETVAISSSDVRPENFNDPSSELSLLKTSENAESCMEKLSLESGLSGCSFEEKTVIRPDMHEHHLESPLNSISRNPFEDEDDADVNSFRSPPNVTHNVSKSNPFDSEEGSEGFAVNESNRNPFADPAEPGEAQVAIVVTQSANKTTTTTSKIPIHRFQPKPILGPSSSPSGALKANQRSPLVIPSPPTSALTETDLSLIDIMDTVSHMGYNDTATLSVIRSAMAGRDGSAAVPPLGRVLGLLQKELIAERAAGRRGSAVWKPPFVLRVGSWLPDVEESMVSRVYGSQGGGRCVAYYTSVTSDDFRPEPPVTWNAVHRFSQFYQLYCELHPLLTSARVDGMTYTFVDDRMSTWIFGSSESVCHDRRKMLDLWMRELTSDVRAMTVPEVFRVVSRFFDADLRLVQRRQRILASRRQQWKPLLGGSSSTSLPRIPTKDASALARSLFPDGDPLESEPSSEPHGDYAGAAVAENESVPLAVVTMQSRMKSNKRLA